MASKYTKATVLKLFGGSVSATAAFFKCSTQAISQWSEYLPRARNIELKLRRSEVKPFMKKWRKQKQAA